MGNLYTHLTRITDRRIQILSALRQAWHTTPKDFSLINKLNSELKSIKKPNVQRKKWVGQFG